MNVNMREKSPRAPSMALDQALEKVMRVYDQERLHEAPADAVAQALGFKNANNGSALSTIASMRQFGLIDRPKDGFLAVSKAVETYKYAPDEVLKTKILQEFLETPALYLELLSKYPHSLPSPATLKFELIQKGFLPQAVDATLSAFLGSAAYVRSFGPVQEIGPTQHDATHATPVPKEESTTPLETGKTNPEITMHRIADAECDQIPIRLSGGRKAWLSVPSPFYAADKEWLKAQIDVLFTDDP